MKYAFEFDWVLINKLAVGNVPKNESDLDQLKFNGIKGILCLTSTNESNIKIKKNDFKFIRYPLPDHKQDRLINIDEINHTLELLERLMKVGPTFVHCVASVERSPLICMAWLIKKKGLKVTESLDYLMSVHPKTNPLDKQLQILQGVLSLK